MALQISDTTPRIQYTATSGQTSFSVPFEFFDVADLKVYNGTTLLTYSTSPASASQYSVTGAGVTGGGSITLGGSGATLNDTITIVRDLAIERISDFPVSGNFPIQTLNTELDKIVAMLQQLEEQFARTLQYPVTTTTGFDVDLPDLVANRVLSVNADATALLAEQELGTFQGDWAASTSYKVRDLVKDTSNGNIYFVNAAHTSSGTQPLSSNANSSYYDLIVDAASATTSATNAASSATAASTSATAAANSATAAATSETNAATSESNASTSESNASTSATNASNSATAAATSATNAATSETNAATSATAAATSATNSANSASAASTSETNAANSATAAAASAVDATNNGAAQVALATTQATNAATSASNAATSETNAATSASNASTSETNAANSATSAATSATNANTSATNASNSASAAAASAASAANSYDQFDDRYLGTKTSDPTLDNDGNALVAGALYFNSSANEMRVYDGGNWIPASSAGTASLIIYEYTATSGQTTFSGTDDNAATLSYSVNNLFVTLNGVVLDPDDYTATSGTSIVLGTGATTGDLLTVHAFKSFTVSELNANNLTDGTIPDARFPAVLPAVDGSNLTGITSVGGATGVDFNDNVKARFGTGNDLEIYHSGSHSFVNNEGVGNLYLQNQGDDKDVIIRSDDGSGGLTPYVFADGSNGEVRLFHYGSEKLNTTSSGVDVTGSLIVTKASASGQTAATDTNDLVLDGTTSVGASFLNSNTGTGRIRFGDTDSTSSGLILYNHGSDYFRFDTAGSEAMRIDSSGNVGIGVTPTFTAGGSRKLLQVTNGSNGGQLSLSNDSNESNNPRVFGNAADLGFATGASQSGVMQFYTNTTERMRIHSNGVVGFGTTANSPLSPSESFGVTINDNISGGHYLGVICASSNGSASLFQNRGSDDGVITVFRQANSTEGTISVSGSTINYNGFTGTHWSRLSDNSKPTILKGTILESLDEMMDWYQVQFDITETDDEGNETTKIAKQSYALGDGESVGDVITYTYEGTDYQATIIQEDDVKHTKSKVSDTVDAKNVYGVFVAWDNDDDTVNDMYVAQTGTFVVRLNSSVTTLNKGDLIQSNGDGTGKVQADDIIRSSTVAKVLSTTKIETYEDGSYIVPCSLHC